MKEIDISLGKLDALLERENKSTEKKRNAIAATQSGALTLSEDSLATLFEQEYTGRLVYPHKFGKWFIYNPKKGAWSAEKGNDMVEQALPKGGRPASPQTLAI